VKNYLCVQEYPIQSIKLTTTSVYLLTIPGNPPIEIPRDELRSLLAEIEAQLHRSKVYRRALCNFSRPKWD